MTVATNGTESAKGQNVRNLISEKIVNITIQEIASCLGILIMNLIITIFYTASKKLPVIRENEKLGELSPSASLKL